MSCSSNLRIMGEQTDIAIEFIGGAYTMSISLEDKNGARKQHIRIALTDYSYDDLQMLTSYLHAFISSMDPHEMHSLQYGDDFDEGFENGPNA